MADSHVQPPPTNSGKPIWARLWVIFVATSLLTALVGSFTNEFVSRLLNSGSDQSKHSVAQDEAVAAQQEKGQKTTQTDAVRAAAELTKGLVFVNREDWDTATACFTEAIRLKPDYAKAYYNRGKIYVTPLNLKHRNLDKAHSDLSEAIRLQPNYYDAYIQRGVVYYQKGDFDKAIADDTEAMRLQPDYVDAYLERGFAYVRKKEYDKAIEDYSEGIPRHPTHFLIYERRGDVYSITRQYDKAIADYSEVIRLRPDYVKGYAVRGKLYNVKGDRAKAEADFAKAKELGWKPEQ